MVAEAVDIETEFICAALPCDLIGMNAASMTQYIRFCADRLVLQLGYPALYGDALPETFAFMTKISLPSKTNFFEKRSSEYSRDTNASAAVTFDEDF
jgi:ribonucleoside-diphosphate reductase subunit M2